MGQPSSSVAAAPSFSSACTKEELDAIPLPELANHQRSSAKFPAFSTRLLSHLACASGCKLNAKKTDSSLSHNRSPKVRAVLRNLKIIFRTSSIAIPKIVIFSQMKAALDHMAFVLKEEGYNFVKIARGDNQEHLQKAVHVFNTDPTCIIFLLHASTAAAGLTLTAAQHVFLLEPFLQAGEEAQARNRVHRIGQKSAVQVT